MFQRKQNREGWQSGGQMADMISEEISGLWSHRITRPHWHTVSKYGVIDFRALNTTGIKLTYCKHCTRFDFTKSSSWSPAEFLRIITFTWWLNISTAELKLKTFDFFEKMSLVKKKKRKRTPTKDLEGHDTVNKIKLAAKRGAVQLGQHLQWDSDEAADDNLILVKSSGTMHD